MGARTPGSLEEDFLSGNIGEEPDTRLPARFTPEFDTEVAQSEAESAAEFETEMEIEALSGMDEFDPYSAIRSAMSPEHAGLAADEVTPLLGGMPATVALHHLLNSPQIRQATVASLLGKGARRSVRINGVDVSIPVYLRAVSRLCREVADHSEVELQGVTYGWESPQGLLDDASSAGEGETAERLRKKLKNLSLLPHFTRVGRVDEPLSPGMSNPGIYDGPVKFKVASKLQACLETAIKGLKLGHMKVALIDLTNDSQPEFAGFNHKDQISVAGIPKMAVMLAAFQLRHDLSTVLAKEGAKSIDDLFSTMRDKWADAQSESGAARAFSGRITLKGKIVLVDKRPVPLVDPRAPQLDNIFAPVPAGDPVSVQFSSTGETDDQLNKIVRAFVDADDPGLKSLGFQERLRVMMGVFHGGASNFAASTIIADLGYEYIASTLLQTGLYDPARGGGLWLGSDYARSTWKESLMVAGPQSATAGSLAAFMALLMQDQLIDPGSSAEMQKLMEQSLAGDFLPAGFRTGLEQPGSPPDSLTRVLSRQGMDPGIDECSFFERRAGDTLLRYVAIGLGARKIAELKALIVELDKCVLANHGLTPAQGGYPTPGIQPETEEAETEWHENVFAPSFSAESDSPTETLFTGETGKLGKGSAIRVTDTRAVPFRFICSVAVALRITNEARRESRTGLKPLGTGVLISPCHVLTAAHLLCSREDRASVKEYQEAEDVWIALGRDEDNEPFGKIQAKSWAVHPNWKPDTGIHQYDYALITLSKPVKDGCFWGNAKCGAGTVLNSLSASLASGLIGAPIATAGYPGSMNKQMWCYKGVLSAGSPSVDAALKRQGAEEWARKTALFHITADAERGQSGSPVWVLSEGKRYLIGILIDAGTDLNTTVAVNGPVISQIQSWMKRSTCP